MKILTFWSLSLSNIILLFALLICDVGINAEDKPKTSSNFLTLTLREKQILDKFRERVEPRLTHDYMKAEIYLIRFLRQVDFDLDAATKLLYNMLQWREENHVEKLLDEEYPEFDQEYEIFIEGCDKENRATISIPLGNWNIRQAVIAGQEERLIRYMDKVAEDSLTFLRQLNAAGLEYFQCTILVDLNGFNLITHGCPRCLAIFLNFMSSLQFHYPGFIGKMYFVNTPSFLLPLYDTVKSFVPYKLREVMEFHGTNPGEWKNKLLKDIDRNQLSKRYGGTKKEEPLNYAYFRLGAHMFSSPEQVKALNLTNDCTESMGMVEELVREANSGGIRKKHKC